MQKAYISLFFYLLMTVFPANAQMTPRQKDSILHLYPSVSGVEKLQLIDRLIGYYQRSQPDSAVYYNEILLREAREQSNQKYLALYYYHQGKYYTFQAKYYDSFKGFHRAASMQKEAHLYDDLAGTYKAIAGNYFYLENYNKALEMSYKALKMYDSIHDYSGSIDMINNLALIHKKAENLKIATRLYLKAIRLIDSLHLQKVKTGLYTNLGVVYKNRQMYDSAHYYYQKSIHVDQKNRDIHGLTHNYFNLANLYAFYLKKIDSARFYYQKSLAYAQKYDKNLLLSIQSSVAKMLLENDKIDEGIARMKEVLKNARIKDDKEIKELAYFKLYEAYKKQHRWEAALKNLEDLMDIQDTINRQNTQLQIARLESKYQNEKKQAKIEGLQLKQKLDKKIKIYLTTAIVLLLLSFGLLMRNFFNKQKRNRLEKELLKTEKEKLHQDIRFKTKQLTSQALMMMQKNKLIDDILTQLSTIKGSGAKHTDLNKLKRKLKKSLHSEDDWELFKHYFEEINKDFFKRLKQINSKITPAEQRLSALVKLRFNIKETAELLNISPDSVKTARSQLRKKLGLASGVNIYEFLNNI